MKKRDFTNQVVVITGAGGGLGQALCHRFLQAKAKVMALDIHTEGLEKIASSLPDGADFHFQSCDITKAEECQKAIKIAQENLGPIDVLVNNAGITHLSDFRETELSTIEKVMGVNFFGSAYCTKAALEDIVQKKGMIITISSVAGYSPLVARTGYAASKHALHGFFDSLRAELKGQGVDILIVCPSFINTPIRAKASAQNESKSGEIRQPGGPQKMIGKVHSPEEVAEEIFQAAIQRKRLFVQGRVGKLAYWVNTFFPRFFEKKMIQKVR